MQIIYVYGGCSPKKYGEYVENKGVRVQQQSQKYNQLLMEGLVANGAQVEAISSRPINRSIDNRIFFKSEKDCECGINYSYPWFINYSVLRKATVFINIFFKILFLKIEKECSIMCDALNIAASFGALLVAKLRGIKAIGIITDVPCHRPNNLKPSKNEKINLWLMKRFNGYLLLTEQMNEIVNPKNLPYVVLEGHSDIVMKEVNNHLEDKFQKKACFYAGTLRKIYGIKTLVEGFLNADIPDTELHIYGDGDFRKELEELAKENDSVKYMGVAPNSDIVKAELKATLLVNPRPTNEDYTKYSFPSKNMEYMASGTPVLTTELPGMPQDHKPYVYLIKNETAEGIAEALRNVLEKTPEELHSFGLAAKEFILKEKNNISQAKKVLDFIDKSF